MKPRHAWWLSRTVGEEHPFSCLNSKREVLQCLLIHEPEMRAKFGRFS